MNERTAPSTAIWVADTEPNERFALYSRGNAGEVFPHVITALTGTLIGEPVRQGQVEAFVEMAHTAAVPRRPHPTTVVSGANPVSRHVAPPC